MLTTDQNTVQDFLDGLAAPSAAPGGGGAAAVSGAMGAALLSMCCNLTLGRSRFAAAEEALKATLAESGRLRRRLTTLAEADQQAFEQVMAAYSRPKTTEAEQQIRQAEVQTALLAATQSQLDIVIACAQAIRLIRQAIDKINPNTLGDAAAGMRLADAGLQTARLNMGINLGLLHDPQPLPEFEVALKETLAGIDQTTRHIFNYVQSHSKALPQFTNLALLDLRG
jgi:formiminotetrahydrofolate cyclodeaminase